ncbi:uncharacterized protein LOC131298285 isoform X1 [Rhododendron vialii]|uniref:uncharacterized protein LOC131298285 isoform X1 n=1 Tax=Rhododendron vialii TaxID=182163 RepID=UPI00265F7F87|nr:uncharacterized protein LOC131298285 isoform X1 [Rhododendron vialii]
MTDMDGAPPSPSHGDNGGFNSSGVRAHLLWAVSYGVASAIALRTIDALTCKRTTNQPGSEKPKEKEKEKVEEKTTTTTNPTVCHVNVFPSVNTITNSKDSSTLITTKKEDQTATASSTPTKLSEKNGGDNAAVAGSNGGVLGPFSRRQAPQAKALPPPICKHVLDFYYDCLHVATEKKCEGYINLTEKCHQIGPTSADISNVSDDRQNSTLHPPAELLHMSYHGCRKKNQYDSCKKYLTYVSETSQNS